MIDQPLSTSFRSLRLIKDSPLTKPANLPFQAYRIVSLYFQWIGTVELQQCSIARLVQNLDEEQRAPDCSDLPALCSELPALRPLLACPSGACSSIRNKGDAHAAERNDVSVEPRPLPTDLGADIRPYRKTKSDSIGNLDHHLRHPALPVQWSDRFLSVWPVCSGRRGRCSRGSVPGNPSRSLERSRSGKAERLPRHQQQYRDSVGSCRRQLRTDLVFLLAQHLLDPAQRVLWTPPRICSVGSGEHSREDHPAGAYELRPDTHPSQLHACDSRFCSRVWRPRCLPDHRSIPLPICSLCPPGCIWLVGGLHHYLLPGCKVDERQPCTKSGCEETPPHRRTEHVAGFSGNVGLFMFRSFKRMGRSGPFHGL